MGRSAADYIDRYGVQADMRSLEIMVQIADETIRDLAHTRALIPPEEWRDLFEADYQRELDARQMLATEIKRRLGAEGVAV